MKLKGLRLHQCTKLRMVVEAYNPSTGGGEVEGRPQLHGEYKTKVIPPEASLYGRHNPRRRASFLHALRRYLHPSKGPKNTQSILTLSLEEVGSPTPLGFWDMRPSLLMKESTEKCTAVTLLPVTLHLICSRVLTVL